TNVNREAPFDPVTATDLAPGTYWLTLRTIAKPDVEPLAGTALNPGAFMAYSEIELIAGQPEQVTYRYVPLDPQAYRGDRTAVLKFTSAAGQPLSGKPVEVTYFDGHYGNLTVFSGEIPAAGELTLAGITDRATGDTAIKPYTVTVGGERLG